MTIMKWKISIGYGEACVQCYQHFGVQVTLKDEIITEAQSTCMILQNTLSKNGILFVFDDELMCEWLVVLGKATKSTSWNLIFVVYIVE